jgi:hypothetical protein
VQEIVDMVDWLIGDMSQHVAQPGFGVDNDQLGCSDQSIHGGIAFATAIGTGKQVVSSAQCDAA